MIGLVDFFKVLSDETRLRIMVLLHQKELCVCEIHGILGLSQPKVSKHLAKLRDLGFVDSKRDEKFIVYRIVFPSELHQLILENIVKKSEQFPQLMEDQAKLTRSIEFRCK